MPVTIYRRGSIWHYRGTAGGQRLRGSTKTADKKLAQRIAAEIEARHWKGALDGQEAVLTFANAAHLYLDAGKSERFLARLDQRWGKIPVKSINAGVIKQASIDLYPRASGATRNRQVIVPAQAVINHAAELGKCQPIRVPRWPVEKKEREPATWEWVQTFKAHANPHLGALALFMICTGARISEALAVTWDDVDFGKRRVLIRQTKVGAERWAHMQTELLTAIASLQDRVRTVFRYSSRDTVKPQWDKVVRRAKLKHLSPHSLRHGFATGMLHAGVDPVTVAKTGGWKSAQHVFATYGHAMDDETVTDRLVPVSPKQERKLG
jgi:integrase